MRPVYGENENESEAHKQRETDSKNKKNFGDQKRGHIPCQWIVHIFTYRLLIRRSTNLRSKEIFCHLRLLYPSEIPIVASISGY